QRHKSSLLALLIATGVDDQTIQPGREFRIAAKLLNARHEFEKHLLCYGRRRASTLRSSTRGPCTHRRASAARGDRHADRLRSSLNRSSRSLAAALESRLFDRASLIRRR